MTAAPPAPDHRGQLEKLARRGTASVFGAGFSAVFGILLVAVVTNGFSPTLAGTLFAATSTFLILESVALLGTDTGLVKCLPAQLASGRAKDVPRTLVVSAVPALAFAVTIATSLFLAAPSLAPHLVGAGAADTMTLMLRTLALVLPVAALHDQVMAATRGAGSQKPTVVVENIGRLGLQACSVLVAYLAGGGPLALALAWSLPYVVGLAVGAAWLHQLVVKWTAATSVAATPWGTIAREFWSFTAPRAIARVTQTALKRSDIVLVAALASPADAALYTAATRFIVLGQLFVQSVQQALSPHLSALFAKDNRAAANSVYRASTLWSMIAAWPFYLVARRLRPDAHGRVRRRVRRRLRRRADPVSDHAAGDGLRPGRLGAAHGRPELGEPAQRHRGPDRQRGPQLPAHPDATASGAPRSPGRSRSSCATCCPSSSSAGSSPCGRSPRPPSGWPSVPSSASASWTFSPRSRTYPPSSTSACSPWPWRPTWSASGSRARSWGSTCSVRRCAGRRSAPKLTESEDEAVRVAT